MLRLTDRQVVLLLSTLLGIEFIALAIAPTDRNDWLLENVLFVLFVAAMIASYRKLTLSRNSYLLVFLFLSLHLLGAHYSYAQVPYDRWFESLTRRSVSSLFGWERNNFDRLVHFCYGLLLAYPVREVLQRVVKLRGFWGYFFPLSVTMSTSMCYELIEWGAAALLGGDLGQAYLGTQGDVWDAQKDMAFAGSGALIAMLVTAGINVRFERDFADESNNRLRVKPSRPLRKDEA
jgi:putative membrane protein